MKHNTKIILVDYPGHSGDSNLSSDLSLDGSNFDNLEDGSDTMSLQNLDLQTSQLSSLDGHHYLNHNNNNLSCIDKLYQMQSQYFIAPPIEQWKFILKIHECSQKIYIASRYDLNVPNDLYLDEYRQKAKLDETKMWLKIVFENFKAKSSLLKEKEN